MVSQDDRAKNLIHNFESGKQDQAIRVNSDIEEKPTDVNVEFVFDDIYDLYREYNTYRHYIDMTIETLKHIDFDHRLRIILLTYYASLKDLGEEIENLWHYVKEKDGMLTEMDFSETQHLYDAVEKHNRSNTTRLGKDFFRLKFDIYKTMVKIMNQVPSGNYKKLLETDYLPFLK